MYDLEVLEAQSGSFLSRLPNITRETNKHVLILFRHLCENLQTTTPFVLIQRLHQNDLFQLIGGVRRRLSGVATRIGDRGGIQDG
jgi:hypothetical protein